MVVLLRLEGKGGAALFMSVLEMELEYVVYVVLFMELNGNTTSADP